MKKLVAAVALVAVLFLASFASASRAKENRVRATLNAKQEAPAQSVENARGKGTFSGTLVGRTLSWRLTFSSLTGPASAAHIHMGAMGTAGNVVVALCGPCVSGAHGKATLTAAVVKALKKHLLYVNVHTAKNPNGEIRGQLSAHP